MYMSKYTYVQTMTLVSLSYTWMLSVKLFITDSLTDLYKHCLFFILFSAVSYLPTRMHYNLATWTAARSVDIGNSWTWPNGDLVDFGLAKSTGTGSRLMIDISDFKLHASDPASIAGPQCEAGENRFSWIQYCRQTTMFKLISITPTSLVAVLIFNINISKNRNYVYGALQYNVRKQFLHNVADP